MSRSRSRIASALLILTLAIPGPFARLWEAILGIWPSASDEGCAIDPHGNCRPPAAVPTSDEGCMMDPHGGCRPPAAAPTSDEGCAMDPHGGCKPGS